jgi:hypothetical protein
MGWSRPLEEGLQLVRPLLGFSRPETLDACDQTGTQVCPQTLCRNVGQKSTCAFMSHCCRVTSVQKVLLCKLVVCILFCDGCCYVLCTWFIAAC